MAFKLLGEVPDETPAPAGSPATPQAESTGFRLPGEVKPEAPKPQTPFRSYGTMLGQVADAATIPLRQVLSGNVNPADIMNRMRGAAEQPSPLAQTAGPMIRDVQTATVMPWSKAAGVPGFLARMGQAAGLSGATALADTGDLKEAGKSAVIGGMTQGAGEGVFKIGRSLLSQIPLGVFQNKSATDLAAWLKSQVPAWAKYKSDATGLYEMVHGDGQTLLQDAYESGLQSIKGKLPTDAVTTIPADVAKKAGIMGMRTPKMATRGPLRVPIESPEVEVSTRALIDALPGLKKAPDMRRAALDALDTTLERASAGIPAEFGQLRNAYKVGSGFREFAESGKFLSRKGYNAAEAQAALRKYYSDVLRPRGMGPVRQIVEGPLGKDIERKNMAGPLAAIGGLVGGATGGSVLPGIGHLGGAVPGAYMGARLGQQIPRYTNVPPMLPGSVRTLTPAMLQVLQQKIQRDLRENRPE